MENKTVSVGRWQYSEPSFEADENGHIVICSKSSVAPAELFEWGIDAEKRPFERYRWCENDFYEEANYDKTISKEELTKHIEDIASILKEHGFDAAFEQYNSIKTQINSGLSGQRYRLRQNRARHSKSSSSICLLFQMTALSRSGKRLSAVCCPG